MKKPSRKVRGRAPVDADALAGGVAQRTGSHISQGRDARLRPCTAGALATNTA